MSEQVDKSTARAEAVERMTQKKHEKLMKGKYRDTYEEGGWSLVCKRHPKGALRALRARYPKDPMESIVENES